MTMLAAVSKGHGAGFTLRRSARKIMPQPVQALYSTSARRFSVFGRAWHKDILGDGNYGELLLDAFLLTGRSGVGVIDAISLCAPKMLKLQGRNLYKMKGVDDDHQDTAKNCKLSS